MRAAVSIIFVGAGTLAAGWVLPMLRANLPRWLQIALLILGILLIICGALVGVNADRSKRDGISVRMRDNNSIGQIGNQK
jgi:hypothetical protein